MLNYGWLILFKYNNFTYIYIILILFMEEWKRSCYAGIMMSDNEKHNKIQQSES